MAEVSNADGFPFSADDNPQTNTEPEPRCLVIVPAYNEARSLPGLTEEVRAVAQPLKIVVVDDGLLDGPWLIADRLGVVALRNPFNRGIGVAMRAVFIHAIGHGSDIASQVDGDGQVRQHQIPLLLASMLSCSRIRANLVSGTSRVAGG